MEKSKHICLILFFIVTVQGHLFCQYNEQVDILLQEQKATFGRVVYIVLAAGELITGEETIEQALGVLHEKEWGISIIASDSPVTLGDCSYLLMNVFDIPGGVMYAMFPSPRYAVRELAYLNILTGSPDPSRSVTGEEVMNLLAQTIDWKEAR
jgi:hypothetical protein